MPLSLADFALWVPPRLLLAGVAVAMYRRGLHREYPFFFTALVYAVVRTAVLLLAYNHSELAYFFAYYVADAVEVPISLAVILELFQHLFGPYAAIRGMGTSLFRGSLVAFLVLAAATAWFAPGGDRYPILGDIMALERSAAMVRAGLLFLLFVVARYFGLTWKHHALGIALGVGVISSVALAAYTIRAQAGQAADLVSYATRGAFVVAVGIWAAYFFRPEPVPKALQVPPKAELDAWNRTLAELLSR